MAELLDVAVRAHGGLDHWRRSAQSGWQLPLQERSGSVKGQGDVLKNVVLTADTANERLGVEFPGQDKRAVFEPQRIVIQHMDGKLIAQRDDPEQSFVGQQRETPSGTISTSSTSSARRSGPI